jgi:nitroreductase
MDFSDVVSRRRMVRSYDPTRPVPAAALDALVSASLRAPSAGHAQGVSLLVLRERADIEDYWSATAEPGQPDRWLRGMRTAPVLILVWTSVQTYLDRYAEPDKGWVDRDESRWPAPYWFVDAGMASMVALLSAVDQKLGACFFGLPLDHLAAVRERFRVPQDQLSVGVISVGYPDPSAAVSRPARTIRRSRQERVHFGLW